MRGAPVNSAKKIYPQGIMWSSNHIPMGRMGHRASGKYTSVIYCEEKAAPFSLLWLPAANPWRLDVKPN